MTQALFLNFGILIAVVSCMLVTSNPLALFALLLIKELPFGLLLQDDDEDEPVEAEGRPMGFV